MNFILFQNSFLVSETQATTGHIIGNANSNLKNYSLSLNFQEHKMALKISKTSDND